MKIAFNSANLVGRVSGYRFKLADWMQQHQRTVRGTDAEAFAAVCREIAETGFRAVELWQALADPSVMTEERAREWRAIMADHSLEPIAYGGYIGTGAERVAPWLGIETINGGFNLKPDEATELCRRHAVRCNFENHPQKTTDEILAPIGGGNEWLGVCVDTGWLGTQGVDAPETIRKLGPLVRHVHVKDVKAAGRHDTCNLGEGVVDVAGCLRALRDVGYDGWLAWEDEPEDRNPLEAAAANLAWLERELSELGA
ncbi:MAG: sugar phosphate isomerase/epimerase family protein [Candidatus Binatia bacterium]